MKRADVVRNGLTIAGFLIYLFVLVLSLHALLPLVAHWLGVTP